MPESGPVIIVANHPLGGIEGLQLTQIMLSKRPDLKVMTNELLATLPEYKDVFVGVDVLNAGRAQHNAGSVREVARHLGGGGALLVFPAGTVSRMKFPTTEVEDAPWSMMIARLAPQIQGVRAACVCGRSESRLVLPFRMGAQTSAHAAVAACHASNGGEDNRSAFWPDHTAKGYNPAWG